MPESDRDKTIEVMARGIYANTRSSRQAAEIKAHAAYVALQAAGMAVVVASEARQAWRVGMLNAAATCRLFSDAKNAAREIEALAASDDVADHNLRAASPDGKAFQPMGSAEAQRAVAHMGSEKEKGDA